jgi:hypothetical protein
VDENYQQQTLDDYLCQSVEETKQSKGQWINQISDGE